MISYRIDEADLLRAIDLVKPGWLERAKTKTNALISAGRYEGSENFWSEIKPVFMNLQGNKCIFCETRLEGGRLGRRQHDLEHFRPKSSVREWRSSSDLPNEFPSTGGPGDGYYWLAYDPLNYAAACKTCNSDLKSNYFPIAGQRGNSPKRPAELALEAPFLCYPIGQIDEDPASLVTFEGPLAFATGNDRQQARGQVIIELFKLNDRDDLRYGRAEAIKNLGQALLLTELGNDPDRNRRIVELSVRNTAPYASSSRCFLKKWRRDRALAQQIYEECQDLLLQAGEGSWLA